MKILRRFSSRFTNFMNGSNIAYIESQYIAWKSEPKSVHSSWDSFFSTNSFSLPSSSNHQIRFLVDSYRRRGHIASRLDPLQLKETTTFSVTNTDSHDHLYNTSIDELVQILKTTYCNTIGFEVEHLNNHEELQWLRNQIETSHTFLTQKERLHLLERLAFSEHFEIFFGTKFGTTKRFGLEGCESMIPGMKTMIDEATLHGVTDIIIGMPHRGRLNVLCNVVRKPIEVLLREFSSSDTHENKEQEWINHGDVKYHLGTSYTRTYDDNRTVHIELLPNPSHLEAVNPIVLGKCRACMDTKGDIDGNTVLPVIIHGDAAFSGQGIVYETMQMANLPAYKTGGTCHIICNNQVGFTCEPEQSRSTLYASDIGKAFETPIFHVNADDPEAVCKVFKLAIHWRQKFKRDVIIDLIGYRKNGHNEIDEPAFTQPLMYDKIKNHKSVLTQYITTIQNSNPIIDKESIENVLCHVRTTFDKAFENKEHFVWDTNVWGQKWKYMVNPNTFGVGTHNKTGIHIDTLNKIGNVLTSIPEGFQIHKRLVSRFKSYKKNIKAGTNIDWALSEALAFGSLLHDTIPIRFTGQDVERGTFTHRHAVIHDQKTKEQYCFLNNISQAKFDIHNSFLSEYGVLGFELGYSFESPNLLCIWEAQFGDFVNGAQIIIDQYLSSCETKWLRQTGLVLLLPHGYQGQGPEHSSCRMERFLQSCDEDTEYTTFKDQTRQLQLCNWQIINPTTPANYFHALRRQQYRDFRKPLIVVSTKALLRHKLATSNIEDFVTGTQFQNTYDETYPQELVAASDIKKIVFCSGKFYYELLEERRNNDIKDVVLLRIEQLSPFPFDHIAKYIKKYNNAHVVWCQEEPKNQGAWNYVKDRINNCIQSSGQNKVIKYYGRPTMASTAEGYNQRHIIQQNKIIKNVFTH